MNHAFTSDKTLKEGDVREPYLCPISHKYVRSISRSLSRVNPDCGAARLLAAFETIA